MSSDDSRGICVWMHGRAWQKYAVVSLRSLRSHSQLPVCLIASGEYDREWMSRLVSEVSNLRVLDYELRYAHVPLRRKRRRYIEKAVLFDLLSPFGLTLCCDLDTIYARDVPEDAWQQIAEDGMCVPTESFGGNLRQFAGKHAVVLKLEWQSLFAGLFPDAANIDPEANVYRATTCLFGFRRGCEAAAKWRAAVDAAIEAQCRLPIGEPGLLTLRIGDEFVLSYLLAIGEVTVFANTNMLRHQRYKGISPGELISRRRLREIPDGCFMMHFGAGFATKSGLWKAAMREAIAADACGLRTMPHWYDVAEITETAETADGSQV